MNRKSTDCVRVGKTSGPRKEYKYWAWYRVNGFLLASQAYGGELVAGSLLAPDPSPPRWFVRLRVCAWVLDWAFAQLPRVPWLLRVVGRCVLGRVLLRSVRVFFLCRNTVLCFYVMGSYYKRAKRHLFNGGAITKSRNHTLEKGLTNETPRKVIALLSPFFFLPFFAGLTFSPPVCK